jgi:hypothetical protein
MRQTSWVDDARFASWWLTLEDLGWPDRRLTEKWERRAQTFRELGVNAAAMFGFHCRWDYTTICERVWGALREVANICHANGLKVVEHHSAILVHRVRNEQDRHQIRARNSHHVPYYPDNWETAVYRGQPMADWRQISARDNRPVWYERYTSECFCPNNPDWQQAYQDYVNRHLEAVPVDALMSDDLHFLPDVYTCGCLHCRQKFAEEEGITLPSIDDRNFWEDYSNTDFLKWIEARYRWNAEHYRRMREGLPGEVLLWGCASDCITAKLAELGFSPQHAVLHTDAVFHEIVGWLQPGRDDERISSEIAAFASLSRHHAKPLIVIFYPTTPQDLPAWIDIVSRHGARPWISRQPRSENSVPEEELLADGFPQLITAPAESDLEGIVFSESARDRLGPQAEQKYVAPYRKLCADLLKKGKTVDVFLDSFRNRADPRTWSTLWVPCSDLLDNELVERIAGWERQGLRVNRLKDGAA